LGSNPDKGKKELLSAVGRAYLHLS